MPKPVLQLMVGDSELRAIGHVAAQWAYLETQLDGVIDILIDQLAAKQLQSRQTQSFQRRMERLHEVARVVLAQHPDELSELLAITTDASSLRGFRDDIVHGQWKLLRQGRKRQLATGIRVSTQVPRLKVRNLIFSAKKAEGVACKIATTHLRLIQWTMRNIR